MVQFRSFVVPLTGLEPVRMLLRGILSPLRLPIPPQRHNMIKRKLCTVKCRVFLEAPPGFEPGVKVLQTLALPLGDSAVLPVRLVKRKNSADIWSGKRDSNPRHSPWQGDALPLSYSRIFLSALSFVGGSYRVRTYDPLLVRQMLSQLS